MRFKQPSALPGFAFALGYTVLYLGIIVLLPLAALVATAAGMGLRGILAVATEPRVLAALRVSFGLAFAAVLVHCGFGLLIAWVLTRYRFPGRTSICTRPSICLLRCRPRWPVSPARPSMRRMAGLWRGVG